MHTCLLLKHATVITPELQVAISIAAGHPFPRGPPCRTVNFLVISSSWCYILISELRHQMMIQMMTSITYSCWLGPAAVGSLPIDKLTGFPHGRPPFAIPFHASARFRLGLSTTGMYRNHPTRLLGIHPAHRRSTKGITTPARTLWALAIRNSLPQVSVNTFLYTWSKRRPTALTQTPVHLSNLQS